MASNSKVNCSVQRDAASLIAPDTIKANKLLQFASYEFDFYARKLQKNLRAERNLSNVSFKGTIRPNSKEIIEEHAMASKTTNWALTQETYCAAY
jgi:hypothetical protein